MNAVFMNYGKDRYIALPNLYMEKDTDKILNLLYMEKDKKVT